MVTSKTFIETISKEHDEIILAVKNRDIKNLCDAQKNHFKTAKRVINEFYS